MQRQFFALQPLNYADQARLIQQFPIEDQIELLSGLDASRLGI